MEEALTCGELVSVRDGGVVLCLVVLVLSFLSCPCVGVVGAPHIFCSRQDKDPTHSDWLISWESFRVSSVT